MTIKCRIYPTLFTYDGNDNVRLHESVYDTFIQVGILTQINNKNFSKADGSSKKFRSVKFEKTNISYKKNISPFEILDNMGTKNTYILSTAHSLLGDTTKLFLGVNFLSNNEKTNISEYYEKDFESILKETLDKEYIKRISDFPTKPLILEIDHRKLTKLKLLSDELFFVHQYCDDIIRCLDMMS